MDAAVQVDAPPDAPRDAPPPPTRWKITFTIAADKVTGPLTEFPVYVELTSDDLKTRLDAAAANLSFRTRNGQTTTPLAHELQSYDSGNGRLRAWVKLPTVEATAGADTVFELQYGAGVAVAPNPAGVWSEGFLAVYHLEQLTGGVFVNSAVATNPGTPVGVDAGDLTNTQLGRGVDFAGNNGRVITFANSLSGNMPSTISAWVSEGNTNSNDSLVQLGDAQNSRARFFYTRYNSDNLGSGLYNDDWTTSTSIRGAGWKLLHWSYAAQQGRIFVNGVQISGSPFSYQQDANTAGTDGRIGNAASGFGPNMGIDAHVDEVRIANTTRSLEWTAAEYANQSSPATFFTIGSSEALP